METTIVRYTTRPERADENQALIEKVFVELVATAPTGLRYASFRLADGVSFVHVATVDGNDANPLTSTPAFAEFVRDIAERCVEGPIGSSATVVGEFGFRA